MEEKLKWTFSLYDQDRDGFITKAEMSSIVNAIYKIIDDPIDPKNDDKLIKCKVEKFFQVW